MNGRSFAAKRARIARSGRPERTKRKALAHLVREAGASEIVVGERGRVVAHMMPTGFVLCVLRRFRSEAEAIGELQGVEAFRHLHGDKRLPVRAFWCPHCAGFHTTSQA